MTIISLNAFESPLSRTSRRRLKILLKELIQIRPEIICFQEIIKAKTARRIRHVFEPYGYRTFIQPKRIFNHGGLVCVTKIPVTSFSFTPFKNQGARVSLQLAERIIKKGYQCIVLQTKNSALTIFHTHIAAIFKKNSKKQLKTRLSHVNQLLQEIIKTKGNMILTGDCNFTPHDPEHHLMEKSGRLTDPLGVVYFPTVSPENTNRKKSLIWPKYSVRHDYAWVSKNISPLVKSQKIIFDKPYKIKNKLMHLSDHYGILTEINI